MAPALSDERVQDSSDEESSQSELTQTLAQRVNSIRQSDATAGKNQVLDSDSSSGSDASSISSKSSSNPSSKRKRPQPANSTTAPSPKKVKSSLAKVKRIETTKYAPPSGYTSFQVSPSNLQSKVTSLFDEITDKQVWHITAPASMPITELQSLDIAAALDGNPILEHKGVRYSLARAGSDKTVLLLPRGGMCDYTSAEVPISRSFSIYESSTPAADAREDSNDLSTELGTERIRFFATQLGQTKEARKQPENLRSRYVPFGVHSPPQTLDTTAAKNDRHPRSGTSTPEAARSVTETPVKKAKSKKVAGKDAERTPTPSKLKSQTSGVLESPARGSSKKKKGLLT